MQRLPLALLLALAGPPVLAQTPVNEGPQARPVPNAAHDAEHAPTTNDADRRLPAARQKTDKRDGTTGQDTGVRAKDDMTNRGAKDTNRGAKESTTNRGAKDDTSRRAKDQPPQNKDDAEHAPTRKTDEATSAQPATGERRPGER